MLVLFFVTAVSCANVSPVSTEDSARESIPVFKNIEAITPQWQSFADGVGYFHGKAASPKIEFWALKIELNTPELRVVVKGGADADSSGFYNEPERRSFPRTLSAKVSSFVRDNNLIAGINAVPFDVSSSKEGQPIKNMGIVISGGETAAAANARYDALVFYKSGHGGNGRAAIVPQSAIHSTENIENAVGGFYQILISGQMAKRTQAGSAPSDSAAQPSNMEANASAAPLANAARHPRSAAGISADGERLYLLVIDGRRAGSVGATEAETALLLRALGSADGINFDGGGSSALALRFPDGKVKAVNTPVHGLIPGQERAVAGSLGIRKSAQTREDE